MKILSPYIKIKEFLYKRSGLYFHSHAFYIVYDLQGYWINNYLGKQYSLLEECMKDLDNYLLNNGYILCSQEQWDNYKLLL